MHPRTIARYVDKSVRHPLRAVRNGIEVLRFAMLDHAAEREKLFGFLRDKFNFDAAAALDELGRSEFSRWNRSRREALAEFRGPYRFGSAGEWDCEALYLLVRALKPRVVVETGVCYGCSSSYVLEALIRNGGGDLHSIDLGNTPDEPPSEFFVHPNQKSRWHLHIGDSVELLPALLQRLGQIDLFHHDSLHTYEHMMFEYETALPHLSEQGAISSDDVNIVLSLTNPFQRGPFVDFCKRHGWSWLTARNFGVAVDESRRRA